MEKRLRVKVDTECPESRRLIQAVSSAEFELILKELSCLAMELARKSGTEISILRAFSELLASQSKAEFTEALLTRVNESVLANQPATPAPSAKTEETPEETSPTTSDPLVVGDNMLSGSITDMFSNSAN